MSEILQTLKGLWNIGKNITLIQKPQGYATREVQPMSLRVHGRKLNKILENQSKPWTKGIIRDDLESNLGMQGYFSISS
jgi:hypothetical protein